MVAGDENYGAVWSNCGSGIDTGSHSAALKCRSDCIRGRRQRFSVVGKPDFALTSPVGLPDRKVCETCGYDFTLRSDFHQPRARDIVEEGVPQAWFECGVVNVA